MYVCDSYIKAGDTYFKPARPIGRHLRVDAQGLLVVQLLKVQDNKVMQPPIVLKGGGVGAEGLLFDISFFR